MINEAIHFIRKFEEDGQEEPTFEYRINQIVQKYPKIVVINAKLDNSFKYEDFVFLTSEHEKIKSEIEKISGRSAEFIKNPTTWLSDSEEILKYLNFRHYAKPMSEINKCIGSTSGLISFSLFHFMINPEWVLYVYKTDKSSIKTKIKKFKYKAEDLKQFKADLKDDYKLLDNLNKSDGIRKIYTDFIKDLLEKFALTEESIKEYIEKNLSEKEDEKLDSSEQKIKSTVKFLYNTIKGSYVYCNIGQSLQLIDKARTSYLQSRIFLSDETVAEKSTCPLCGEENTKIGYPSSYNSLNTSKKPFNVHNDKYISYNIRACIDCVLRLNDFEQFLREHKIDFFPLFIKKDFKIKEIKYLKQRGQDALTFFEVLEHILDNTEVDELDFILMHYKGDILYYDYVSNYSFWLGTYKSYFVNSETERRVNLRWLKDRLEERDILGIKTSHFFGDLKGIKNQQQKYLLYKYRDKIFDQVYRNQQYLTGGDISEIVSSRIDSRIINGNASWPRDNSNSAEKKTLDFYMNSNLFIKNLDKFVQKNGGVNMLDEIRKEKEKILQGADLEIDSNEKFAYYLGQVIYYLISLSKTDNKMSLLEPIVNCQSPQALQTIVVEKYFDKYKHELSFYQDFRHKIFASTLDYLNSKLDVSFNKIKVPFYAGFFDENIFYKKAEKTEVKA